MIIDDSFDAYAGDYDQLCADALALSGEGKSYFASARLAFLRRWWEARRRPEPRVIVDLGCGVGDVTSLLADVFPSTIIKGLDRSGRSIEVARSRFTRDRVSFIHQLEPPVRGRLGDVDLVHVNGVVHHVPVEERPQFITSIRDLLVPGGVAAIFENNPWNPATRYVMSQLPFDRDAIPITAGDLSKLLAAAGLQSDTIKFLFYFPHALRALRPLEGLLGDVPMGGQYAVLCEAVLDARRGR